MKDTVLEPIAATGYNYQVLLDSERTQQFKQAINAYVTEGSTVLELGGGTGVLSWLAAQKARKVFCVESNAHSAATATKFLSKNKNGDRVQVVVDDLMTYVPAEPVSVVICEQLHSGMLRTKQIQVIEAFKRNFVKQFGAEVALPRFIPEHTFLGIQLVEQNFTFEGYHAPIPLFAIPTLAQGDTKELSEPAIYAQCEYGKPLPQVFATSQELPVTQNGSVNAVRFITKNILAVLLSEEKTVDWHSYYMVLPLETAIPVKAGERVKISFSYTAGADLHSIAVTGFKV